MAKKIPSSFNILPQAIYVFAITILLMVSGYFLFWLGKNATTIEDEVEGGIKRVYTTITDVGDDIIDYVEEGGEYIEENGYDDVLDIERDMGVDIERVTTMPPSTTMPPAISTDCPNLLIKKGNQLALYNKNKPEKPGENPIYFKNLDEYIYYTKVQRIQDGKNCPVLYLQEETTAQGEDVYRIRPGPFHTQGGVTPEQQCLPSMMNHVSQYFQPKPIEVPLLGKQFPQKAPSPFNKPQPNHPPMVPYLDANRQMNPHGFYGFDPTNQYVGRYTILDQIHDSTKTQNPDGLSDNPMDPNWGGAVFTHKQILSGKYKGDTVKPNVNALPTQAPSVIPTLAPPALPTLAPSVIPTLAPPALPTLAPSVIPTLAPLNGTGASDNPMDTNWGGVEKTKEHVKEGVYKDNNVAIAVNTD